MSGVNHKTSCGQLDPQTLEMIEQKRRLAIEKRNKRQAIESNKVMSMSTKTASTVTGSTSNTSSVCLTSVKPKHIEPKSCDASHALKGVVTAKKTHLKVWTRLVTDKRFEMNFEYNKEVVQVLRQIKSRDFNFSTKKWTFDINDYKTIITTLQTISSVEFQFVDSVPDRVITALIGARNQPKEDIDLNQRLSPQLIQRLFDFQVEGIKFGIRTGGRCLIADDMGLGKTLQAISIAQWYRQDWPLLIVCPSSLRFQWRDQIIEWLPEVSDNDIFVVTKEKGSLAKALITIVSYDLMARMRTQLTIECKQIYNFVILDESHYIKNDSALRTDAVYLSAKASKRVLLLTGTPALSRPMELFTQIKLIDPKLFASKHEFGMRYCDGQLKHFWQRGKYSQQKHVWDYKGAKNLEELKILLESTILVRRLKTEVLNELTKKKREMIILSVDHLSDKEKKKMRDYWLFNRKTAFKLMDNHSHFEWYMDSALAKVEPVCQYLQQLLNQNTKLICFCHHKQMMDSIQEVLCQKRVNHIRIDGQTLPHDRQEACNEFQSVTDCRVALLSITACATGLNLTAASVVVFAELFWNPGVLSQAEDRVHRIGQTKDVKIYYLIAKNTIDDMIWPMISKKLEVLNKAGLSKDTFTEASTALNALEAEQHLITEFFSSLTEEERSFLMDDDFGE